MPVPDSASLRELVARLRARLDGTGSVDTESRELLVTLTRDIERALKPSAADAAPLAHPVERLEGLAVRFEAEHPGLAQVLRELVDALGKAGI